MPNFDTKPWSTILELTQAYVVPLVLIVVAAYIAFRLARLFVHGIVKALLDREATEGTAQELSAVELKKRMDTLDQLGGSVLQFVIAAIAGLMILGRLGFDIAPAVAGIGVVGIAVGFGAQSLVRDYLNGSLILLENQFAKGDVIRAAGVAGTVEDFTLRRTTLRDLDGVVHTVPNGEIKVASNLTRTWSRINQDVTVAYGTDIDKAIRVVEVVGREMADDPGGACGGPGRVRRHAQDPRLRPGRRPVGRQRRLPQASAGGVRGQRHRDPTPPAGRPVAGSRAWHRPPGGARPGRPGGRHGVGLGSTAPSHRHASMRAR